jgi:hypothetical protein
MQYKSSACFFKIYFHIITPYTNLDIACGILSLGVTTKMYKFLVFPALATF